MNLQLTPMLDNIISVKDIHRRNDVNILDRSVCKFAGLGIGAGARIDSNLYRKIEILG